MGYGAWLHGEAVAAGMVLAARLSQRLGLIAMQDVSRISALLARAGLPVTPPDLGLARFLELMRHDKKIEAGRIRFVLLNRIGDAAICDQIPAEALADILGTVAHA